MRPWQWMKAQENDEIALFDVTVFDIDDALEDISMAAAWPATKVKKKSSEQPAYLARQARARRARDEKREREWKAEQERQWGPRKAPPPPPPPRPKWTPEQREAMLREAQVRAEKRKRAAELRRMAAELDAEVGRTPFDNETFGKSKFRMRNPHLFD